MVPSTSSISAPGGEEDGVEVGQVGGQLLAGRDGPQFVPQLGVGRHAVIPGAGLQPLAGKA